MIDRLKLLVTERTAKAKEKEKLRRRLVTLEKEIATLARSVRKTNNTMLKEMPDVADISATMTSAVEGGNVQCSMKHVAKLRAAFCGEKKMSVSGH